MDAFVKLLGIGKHRLYKLLHGIMDGRHLRKGLSSSEAPKSRLVHLLLSHIYSHDAEPLLRTDDNGQVPGPRCDDPFDPAAEHSPHKFNDDPATAYSKAIALLDGWRPGEEASILMTKVDQLPIRHLPPGSVSDLHLQILSLCQVREIPKEEWPSYWTSRAVYLEIWKEVLRFKPESLHSLCQTCYELRSAIFRKHIDWGIKLKKALDWREHLRQQSEDRAIYWAWKSASRAYDCTFVCIIIDACDKAKGVWPRWPRGRYPKDVAKVFADCPRPRSVLTAAIAHGWCTDFYLTDNEMPGGATIFCEILCQVFDHMWALCKANNWRFPAHLIVMSGNTVAQAKNQFALNFLALLVSRRKFATACLNFLMVGHTHEDVDQWFALFVDLVLRRHRFQNPKQLVNHLQEELGDRVRRKGESCRVKELLAIRDFKPWLDQLRTPHLE